MGRVVITKADESPIIAFANANGVSVAGHVETRAVIAEDDRPLLVWQHTVAPGSAITWHEPPEGHAVYVHQGDVDVNGTPLRKGGAVIVEHGSSAVVRAASGGATLLHFHRADGASEPLKKCGGHIHIVNETEAKRYGGANFEGARADIIIYADSTCPTCDLWLHRADMFQPFPGSPAHLHTEDEIIVVTHGTMTLGKRQLSDVTALAIDADTTYKFGLGSEAMSFVNFRACDPYLVMVKPEGNSPPVSERILLEKMK